MEGFWENEKFTGDQQRVYDDATGNIFIGRTEDGRRVEFGKMYIAERDEVYEGQFQSQNMHGEGTLYRRSGEVLWGNFVNNHLDG